MIEFTLTQTQIQQFITIGWYFVYIYIASLIIRIIDYFHIPDLIFVILVLKYEKRIKGCR